MLQVIQSPAASAVALTALVDRAALTLTNARSSAEILEAVEQAGVAYDTAKRAARFGKAKSAADHLIVTAHRVQADALDIEANAKRRLADEYDAAQERGEVRKHGGDQYNKIRGSDLDPATAKEAGVDPNQIQEAREIRDAEREDPGIVRRTLDEALDAGEEPTRAKVKRAVKAKSKRKRRPKPNFVKSTETQHDRDLQMLLGVWGAACETARAAFLRAVTH